MVTYKQASTKHELEQILLLQQKNLSKNLSPREQEEEGFLTVEHTMDILEAMNNVCGHIIALENGKIVGYALCMHPKFGDSMEILKPMFVEINKEFQGKSNYMVMGQICVAKSHRGQGVFRNLYRTMKKELPKEYNTIITEVDSKNKRSLNAHKAIGFKELKRHHSKGREWILIVY